MNPVSALTYEPKPRDFTARFSRGRARSLRSARRRAHGARHAAVLLAAVALPAFAAPDEWSAFAGDVTTQPRPAVAAMPFERPGDSFPGSAFYYLAADDSAPPLAADVHSDADTPSAIGPAALAMRVDAAGDRARALHCLTSAIYYEAASEPDAGQRAVAQVVLNRVAHPAYPKTVCGVVYQGSERRTGCQFTFTCDGSLARAPVRMFWLRAESVARAALSGYVHAPAGLATHYHTIQVHPYWAGSLAYLGTIGAHRFYRFGGAAGRAGAFRFAYGGGEPAAGPHPRIESEDATLAAAAVVDPVAVQRTFDAAPASIKAPTSLPPPAYAPELEQRGGDALYRGDRLPGSGGVRPEYQNSGRWIARPGA